MKIKHEIRGGKRCKNIAQNFVTNPVTNEIQKTMRRQKYQLV